MLVGEREQMMSDSPPLTNEVEFPDRKEITEEERAKGLRGKTGLNLLFLRGEYAVGEGEKKCEEMRGNAKIVQKLCGDLEKPKI